MSQGQVTEGYWAKGCCWQGPQGQQLSVTHLVTLLAFADPPADIELVGCADDALPLHEALPHCHLHWQKQV